MASDPLEHPEVVALVQRSRRLGSDPRVTNYGGGNTSAKVELEDPITGESYSRDPRHVAAKAERYLEGSGIAQLSYWGPEAEFYIFDSVRFDQD